MGVYFHVPNLLLTCQKLCPYHFQVKLFHMSSAFHYTHLSSRIKSYINSALEAATGFIFWADAWVPVLRVSENL